MPSMFIRNVIRESKKAARESANKHAKDLELLDAMHLKLVLAGVKLKKLSEYTNIAQWGSSCLEHEVTDSREWGKIHSVLGKLECVSKDAVYDSNNRITVVMRPHDTKTHWLFKFTFEKELSENDKCKIEKVTRSYDEHIVVCGK